MTHLQIIENPHALGQTNYKISIIMPSLNEAENIEGAIDNVVAAFRKLEISGEIIVINDGSTDRTGEIVEELFKKYSFLRMIRHDIPKGIGASYWQGIWNSRGEIVTMMPGDGENDAYEILRYLPLMEHVDIIIPFFYNKEARTPSRRLISKTYKAIINLSFGILLNYMNGTVMYRKSILAGTTLRNSGFFFQTELLIKCLKKDYLYAEVPYAIKQRASGTSKALSLKSLIKVISGYISMMITIYLLGHETEFINPESKTFQRLQTLKASNLLPQEHSPKE